MGSIGSGELLVIVVVALFALDPRSAGRWWAKLQVWRRRLLEIRTDLERQIQPHLDIAPTPAPTAEDSSPRGEATRRLRQWADRRVDALPASARLLGGAYLQRLRSWEVYRESRAVAAFWPIADEVPLIELLQGVLDDGKSLWLPWLGDQEGFMEMGRVEDLSLDLQEGPWGTREPLATRRGEVFPVSGLVLVPGKVFDLHGARIGKGKGYYDRWLARRTDVHPVGVAWEAQVHPGRLPSSQHDMPMRSLLTEERLVTFRTAVIEPAPNGPEISTANATEDDHA